MNEIVLRMIDTQALLFLYMVVGVVVSKAGIITPKNRGALVRLLVDVCVPFMVLDAFNRTYTADELHACVVIMVMAVVLCAISGVLGFVLWRGQPARRRQVLQYATMFSNAGIAGLPVVLLVYGDIGVFYASMYLIPPRVIQWTLGISMFSGKMADFKTFVNKVLLNPVVVVVYIGFAMMLTGMTFDGVLGSAIENIGDVTAPVSMMLMGATLAAMDPRMLLDRCVWLLTAVRLAVMPVISIVLLRALHVDVMTLSVCTTLLAMPAATNAATISERYGGDYVFASALVCVSTVLSIVTVPMITYLIQLAVA